MAIIKTMTIDGFYTKEEGINIKHVVSTLNGYTQKEFGRELEHFNMVPKDADALFSKTLNRKLKVIHERSGIFRFPELFIHFEPFESLSEWIFAVAIDHSTFNIFEHQSGAKTALQGHDFRYKNLLEWDLTVNYLLEPGQGIFFRPWLFHSFDQGLVQIFRLEDVEDDN